MKRSEFPQDILDRLASLPAGILPGAHGLPRADAVTPAQLDALTQMARDLKKLTEEAQEEEALITTRAPAYTEVPMTGNPQAKLDPKAIYAKYNKSSSTRNIDE